MNAKANRQASRNARTAIVRSLEERHPDMVVFAGPFDIQCSWPEQRDREIAACKKMKEEFQTAKVPVQVVLTSVGAWVLRAKDGLRNNLEVYKEKIKTQTVKRRRCGGGKGDN